MCIATNLERLSDWAKIEGIACFSCRKVGITDPTYECIHKKMTIIFIVSAQ